MPPASPETAPGAGPLAGHHKYAFVKDLNKGSYGFVQVCTKALRGTCLIQKLLDYGGLACHQLILAHATVTGLTSSCLQLAVDKESPTGQKVSSTSPARHGSVGGMQSQSRLKAALDTGGHQVSRERRAHQRDLCQPRDLQPQPAPPPAHCAVQGGVPHPEAPRHLHGVR